MAAAAAAAQSSRLLLRLPRRLPRSPCAAPPSKCPVLRPARLSPAPSPSSLRRAPLALGSMLPAYSNLASARLVSKLPTEPTACLQGRFANYLSPI